MNKKSYRAKKADSKWDYTSRPSAKDTAAFKGQCRVAYTALKYMVGHLDKFPDWFDDPTKEDIMDAFYTCEGFIGK